MSAKEQQKHSFVHCDRGVTFYRKDRKFAFFRSAAAHCSCAGLFSRMGGGATPPAFFFSFSGRVFATPNKTPSLASLQLFLSLSCSFLPSHAYIPASIFQHFIPSKGGPCAQQPDHFRDWCLTAPVLKKTSLAMGKYTRYFWQFRSEGRRSARCVAFIAHCMAGCSFISPPPDSAAKVQAVYGAVGLCPTAGKLLQHIRLALWPPPRAVFCVGRLTGHRFAVKQGVWPWLTWSNGAVRRSAAHTLPRSRADRARRAAVPKHHISVIKNWKVTFCCQPLLQTGALP